jgi:hypothetical protein
MSAGAWLMAVVVVLSLGALVFLAFVTVETIRKRRVPGRSLWKEFGLGIALVVLFVTSWAGQAVAEWQAYTDEQRELGESIRVGDFFTEFAQSTLENWQSEFLQLFSFVTLAALYIHRGSAESKDTEEKVEASLQRIEQKLGTLPEDTKGKSESWELPDPVISGS